MNGEAILKELEIHGVKGKLSADISSFYEKSRLCVNVAENMSGCFSLGKGLIQGCGMSPLPFNYYMKGVAE